MYGPKAAGAWPTGVSIRGTTGATGAAGTNGTNGADGATGPTGPPGAGDGAVTSDIASIVVPNSTQTTVQSSFAASSSYNNTIFNKSTGALVLDYAFSTDSSALITSAGLTINFGADLSNAQDVIAADYAGLIVAAGVIQMRQISGSSVTMRRVSRRGTIA
jgi:hypothetical protein